MIRSCRIPPLLNRICDDENIRSALLVTSDGELLGASTKKPIKDPESFGSLVADMAVEYRRLGHEFAAVDAIHRSRSDMQCLLMDLDQGLIGVAVVSTASSAVNDCFVIAVAAPDAPPGLFKAKLQGLAVYVQESLSTLAETT